MRPIRSAIIVLALLLAGCATAPKPLQGSFTSQSPQQAAASGERVRWGGSVIEVEPQATRTCFQVLGRPLASNGRPREVDASEGRFLACRAGFYDPALFTDTREITITGRIDGYDTRKIGEYDYRFPRVAADVVYLWPIRERINVVTRPAPWPWWGWW